MSITLPFRSVFRDAAIFSIALTALAVTPLRAQEVLRLWPELEVEGSPESVEVREDGSKVVTDVTDPTLTKYLPPPELANGAAVIIAPGGAMRYLSVPAWEQSTARWLNDHGIAAFVLHYRTLPTSHQIVGTIQELYEFPHANANPLPDDAVMSRTIDLAIADGRQAVRLVREHAEQWLIDPARVGMLGVSAGGGVAIGALVTADEDARADFLISSFGPSLIDVEVPANKPPIFIAVRQFHPNVARALVALYQLWTQAGAPAELHIYDQLDGSPILAPTGEWLEEAHAWMQKRDIVPTSRAAN
jgi:dienelactone hydrolase